MAIGNSLQEKTQTVSEFFTSDLVKKKINEVVGGKDGQRFITAIVSAVNATPALRNCDKMSILGAAMIGEALKLSPSPQLGQYYIVPYKDQAQFQIGYKGYIQLAIRTGQYRTLNAFAVKQGEFISYDPIKCKLSTKVIEDFEAREKAETIGYGATLELVNGFEKTIYWSKKQMESHALKYSQAYASDKNKNTSWSFWSKDFDVMGIKTLLRNLISHWGVMSIEMLDAVQQDFKVEPETVSPETEAKTIDVQQVEQNFFSNENPDAGVEQSAIKK